MALLAIDTSTEYLSIALDLGPARPQIVFESHERVGQGHAEMALPTLQRLLRDAGLERRDLTAIAFGAGPGSFTGLRIGCGIAQGLALALDIPVVPVSAFAAIAASYAESVPVPPRAIAVAIDARMRELYWCVLEWDESAIEGGWREIAEAVVTAPDDVPLWPNTLPNALPHALSNSLPNSLPNELPSEGWVGCGSGFAVYREALLARLGARVRAVAPDVQPRARAMLGIARVALRQGRGIDPALAAPTYLRSRVALTRAERERGVKLAAGSVV